MVHHHNDEMTRELYENHFRVAIFGSARTRPGDARYDQVFDLAKSIGEQNIDVVTGGGPGMMEAANAGHAEGDLNGVAHSIGLTIRLPFEAELNRHLDLHQHFDYFSGRLDEFMRLSNVAVITPGGIGTCLELFYTWQLTQVKHIYGIPIILIGEMWHELIEWVKKYPIKNGLVSPEDVHNIFLARDNEHAMRIILKAQIVYQKEGAKYREKFGSYNLEDVE